MINYDRINLEVLGMNRLFIMTGGSTSAEFEKAIIKNMFLKEEYQNYDIHPDMFQIFEAFEWTPYSCKAYFGQIHITNHQAHG